jgi:hypothetical protein
MTHFHKHPLWHEKLIFFTNKKNSFLSKLGQHELSLDQVKRLWTGVVTWEELTGIKTSGGTKVNAYSSNKTALGKFTGSQSFTFTDSGWNKSVTLKRVEEDTHGLGCLDVGTEESTKFFSQEFRPLALKKLPNGHFLLVPVYAQTQTQAFGKLIRSGDFLKVGFNILTQKADDPLAKGVVEAAKRLGAETILKFGYYPLTWEKAKPRERPKFVFAHAMQCFLFGATGMNSGNKIASDDFQNWPQKDHAYRTWWSEKYLQLSRTKGVEAAKADLDMAESAGLDALGILLIPKCFVPGYYAEAAIMNMIRAAENHTVKIIPDIWGFFPQGTDEDGRRLVLNFFAENLVRVMRKYPNAFYKHGNKYVICMGQPVRRAHYKQIEPFFNLFGGRDNVMLIAGMVDLPSQNRSQGWVDGADLLTAFEVHTSWGDRVLDHTLIAEKKAGKDLCWPVSTGMYTNTGDRNRTTMAEGLGACKIIDLWRAGIKNHSKAVYIASWNDFSEDHQINDSNYRGDTFMRITNYFADYFRTGKAPEINEDRLFVFHHRQLVKAKITEGKWRAKARAWHSTPPSDYVHVVSMLKEPGTLELTLGDKTLKLDRVPSGFHEWLVYVPSKRQHEQPQWNRGSYKLNYPITDQHRAVTPIANLASCRPVVSLFRNHKKLGSVKGRTDIAGEARFSDLCTVGNSAAIPASAAK